MKAIWTIIPLTLLLGVTSGASVAPLPVLTSRVKMEMGSNSTEEVPLNEEFSKTTIKAESKDSCSITVTWQYSGNDDSDVKLSYSLDDEHDTCIWSPSPNPFNITSLYPNTRHKVCIIPDYVPQCTVDTISSECTFAETTSSGPVPPLFYCSPSSKSISIFLSPQDLTCNIIGYRIQLTGYTLWSNESQANTVYLYRNYTNYELTGLVPYTNYEVCISGWVENHYQDEYYGHARCENTQTEQDIPGPPLNVKAKAISTSVLEVSWEQPEQVNGRLIGYPVTRSDDVTGDVHIYTWATSLPLSNLKQCVRYTIIVRAETQAGTGPESVTFGEVLPERVPDPTNIDVSNTSSREAVVSWTAPASLCSITGYWINYTGDILWNEEVDQGFKRTYDNMTSSTLESLVPYTMYTLDISAIVGETAGLEGHQKFTTEEAAPGPPSRLCKLRHDDETSILVAWKPPEEKNGVILRYNVTWYLNAEGGISSERSTGTTGDTRFALQRLEPFHDYLVSVKAMTFVGMGTATEKVFQNNQEGIPPSNLSVTAQSRTELLVTWDYDSNSVSHPLFNISWVFETKYNTTFGSAVSYVNNYVIPDLDSHTEYTICVMVSYEGYGDSCPVCMVYSTWHFPNLDTDEDSIPSSVGLALGLIVGLGLPLIAIVTGVVMYRYDKLPRIKRRSLDNISMTKNNLSNEFKMLPNGDASSDCIIAKLEENQDKNRYVDICPYDKNRVRIQRGQHSESTGYINASFLFDQKFIVSQDPLFNTTEDFWQTIWEYQVSVVIMLASSRPNSGLDHFPKYWPDIDDEWHAEYSKLRILNKDEKLVDKLIHRILFITNPKKKQSLIVNHIQLTPDAEIRAFAEPPALLAIVNQIRSIARHSQNQGSPILVHCGAGSGRNGVFVGVWKLMEYSDSFNQVNLYRIVNEIRLSRPGMIQTEEQYRFMYDCLTEYKRNQ